MTISLRAELRTPARLEVSSFLARSLLALGAERQTRRLRRKIVRFLFSLAHRRLGFSAPGVMIVENGAAFTVDCANTAYLHFAALLLRDGAVEPEVTALLGYLAPRLAVVFDVGANWGYYPLLLGTDPRFAGEVHAFELSPGTAQGLRRLVDLARLEARVRVHGYGLSDRDGEVRISRETHSYLVRVLPENYRGRTDRAQVRRLDGIDLPPPDLIKIDVEGHEAAVLAGARRILERRRPAIVFESWHDARRPQAMLRPIAFLEELGYDLYRPYWRGSPSSARQGVLDLLPVTAQGRVAIAAPLNLFALHRSRAAGFF